MRGKNTLVINGKVYDAITGLPVAAPDTDTSPTRTTIKVTDDRVVAPAAVKAIAQSRSPHHAASTHRTTRRSATLRRDVLKKPAAKTSSNSVRRVQIGHVAKSEHISHFAAHPQPLQSAAPAVAARHIDITPVKPSTSAIVRQKHAMVTKPAKPSQPKLSSRALKEQLIAERLASVETPRERTSSTRSKNRGLFARQPRVATLISASFAVMVLGGYLTYLSMPGLSVRVAAAQADVAATFPDYHPDGYRFTGPVAFAPGQVAINFEANGGATGYTVTEQKSSWDSQAVYDNIVAKADDTNYVTNSQQGLTIYTFDGEAAWVNKGILYTVSGDAPLSNEQLLRIASSL